MDPPKEKIEENIKIKEDDSLDKTEDFKPNQEDTKISQKSTKKLSDLVTNNPKEVTKKKMINIGIQTPSETLGEHGELPLDKPCKIISAIRKDNNDSITFKIEWRARKSGFVPKDSYVSSKIFREKYYDMIIDYYESLIMLDHKTS